MKGRSAFVVAGAAVATVLLLFVVYRSRESPSNSGEQPQKPAGPRPQDPSIPVQRIVEPSASQKQVSRQTSAPERFSPSYTKRPSDRSSTRELRCSLLVEGKEPERSSETLLSRDDDHTCSHKTTLRCSSGTPIPEGLLKGRALVLYMLHGVEGGEADRMTEWDNVEMMLEYGVLPDGLSTELFDGVDYVFYRIASQLKEIQTCAKQKNIRFLWVPPGPCDLCHHGRVLQYLGYSKGNNANWPYRSIVLMNSGVRGPFVHAAGAHWIDTASMAGQPSRPRFGVDDEQAFRTIASPLMSWEYNPHPQSYLLVLPKAALAVIFSTLLNTCSDPTKTVCIFSGELILGDLFMEAGFSIHLFGFNATITDKKSSERLRHQHSVETALNPTLRYHHPCKTMFTKLGGEVWRKKLVSEDTIQAMRRFALHQSLSGRGYGVDFGFLEDQSCDILQ